MFKKPSVQPLRMGSAFHGVGIPEETAPPPVHQSPRPWCTNIREQVASISGILQTRIKNMVSRYITIVNTIVARILAHSGRPNHRNVLANT